MLIPIIIRTRNTSDSLLFMVLKRNDFRAFIILIITDSYVCSYLTVYGAANGE
jgi:hypothetical protein